MYTAEVEKRYQMVAALAASRGDDLELLAGHASTEEGEAIQHMAQLLKASGRWASAEELVRSLVASDRFSNMGEMHPAWILESLKEETPKIIGIILRHLPSRHVRYIVDHLPLSIRRSLPQMIEVFSVPTPLLEVIRKRFERKFRPLRALPLTGKCGFSELSCLKSEELVVLFREIGCAEMALALMGISTQTLRTILNRLPLRDAKRVQGRMKLLEKTSAKLIHQAKFTLIAAAEERAGAHQLFMNIGLAAFARALCKDDETLVRLLQQKLVPELGYLLKRTFEEWSSEGSDGALAERRAVILAMIDALATERAIDAAWKERFAPSTQDRALDEALIA